MLRDLLHALREYGDLDSRAKTELVNDLVADRAAALGLGRIAILDDNEILINVRGRLREGASDTPAGIRLGTRYVRVNVKEMAASPFATVDSVLEEIEPYEEIERILANYEPEGDGAYVWFIPDGYMASLTEVEKVWEQSGGGYFSHESVCVLNTAERPTRCRLDVYYEATSLPSVSSKFIVEAKQSLHYRLDKLKADDGSPLIAKDAPVSYRILSYDTRVIVQGSRILTSGRSSEFGSFGTTMAWMPVR